MDWINLTEDRAQLEVLVNTMSYVMNTNKMYTFFINVLIQFLVSSTCFEQHVFIIRNTICT
jgi:hypothetical protein